MKKVIDEIHLIVSPAETGNVPNFIRGIFFELMREVVDL